MLNVRKTERGERKGIKRDRTTINRLKMYRDRPVRNRDGKLIYQSFKSRSTDHQARVEPNRRWFGPTRTVTQEELDKFRTELSKHQKQPYTVLVKSSKIPFSLLKDPVKEGKMSLLEVESFKSTFGNKATRIRPKLSVGSIEDLAKMASESGDGYKEEEDRNIKVETDYHKMEGKDKQFSKGQSNRIWNELYKVVDSSDVVVQVLDARNPLGTRCYHVEKHLKDNCPHKHMIYVLNKCDLIPNWATKKWLYILGKEFPTIAFHASITKSFGKGSLINLLRQYQKIHNNKQQISVGFIGYPNVGKSSVINTLKQQKCCRVAPIPGETKYWQYITLFKKIFLIDCPGVVYPSQEESEIDTVLKGVVRVENLKNPSEFIPAVLEKTKKVYIQRTYDIDNWVDHFEFLEKLSKKLGKLLKKGDPDYETTSKMVLNDWIRGKIPYFAPPPDDAIHIDESKKKDSIELQPQNVDSIRVKDNFFDEEDQPKTDSNPENKGENDEEDVAWDDVCPDDEEMNEEMNDQIEWENVNPEDEE